MTIAALAFFGLGDPTAVSWGDDLAYHRDNLITYWWMPTWPAAMIFFTILGFNLMGKNSFFDKKMNLDKYIFETFIYEVLEKTLEAV